VRSSTSLGKPAFGEASTGKPMTAIFSAAASTAMGPSEQLTPTMLAPHALAKRATSSAPVPSTICSDSLSDAPAMTGTRLFGCLDRGLDRQAQLGGLPHGLDEERVDPRLQQSTRLLEEDRSDLCAVSRSCGSPVAEEVSARAEGEYDILI
jgi:hypothetical protein